MAEQFVPPVAIEGVCQRAVRAWVTSSHEGVQLMADDQVQLRIRFQETGFLPPGEGVWAEPIRADVGGGTYRLTNSSFFVPLAVGDTVRALVDGHGDLQVVDVLKPSDRVLTTIEYPQALPRDEVTSIADSWTKGTDGWTEGIHVLLYTNWGQGLRVEQIGQVLRRSIGWRAGWIWHGTALPGDRTRGRQGDVDFALDTAPCRLEGHS